MSRSRHTFVATLLAFLVVACTTAAPPITPSPQPTVPDNTPPQATPTPSPSATPTEVATVTPGASPSDTPGTSPSPATRTVTSDDGRVTVDVPLSEPLADEVSVRAMTVDEAPQELKDAGVPQPCYELLPADATFSSPVTITSTWPAASDLGALRFFFHIIRAPAGTWAWLNDSAITYSAESVTVTGTTTHFSTLCRFTDRTDLVVDPPWPRTDLVGAEFDRAVHLVSADPRPNPITVFDAEVVAVDGPIIVTDPFFSDSADSFTQNWMCDGVGEYVVDVRIGIVNFAADNPFFTQTLGIDGGTDGAAVLEMNGQCVDELPMVVLDRFCMSVVHDPIGDFLSFLDMLIWLFPPPEDVEYIEVIIQGANDDEPVRLEYEDGRWYGQLGLRGAGPKTLVSVIVHFTDGTTADVSESIAMTFGGPGFLVRFPEEDRFGDGCE